MWYQLSHSQKDQVDQYAEASWISRSAEKSKQTVDSIASGAPR